MLTLTQLSDLAKNIDIDLFEGLQLPEGSPLDRDTMINTIIMRCGLNIPSYADPYIMKSAIAVWSAKNQYTFEHVAKIYTASYSPIENYDRYEDMSTNRDRTMDDDTLSTNSKNENMFGNNTVTNDLTESHSGKDSTVDENTTSAYDASTYQPENKSTSDLTHGEKITNTGTVGTNISQSKSTTGTTNTAKDVLENEKTTQNNHIRGNIGVTTADAMQKEEYDFLEKYNPYDFIAGLFENDLTLFVY